MKKNPENNKIIENGRLSIDGEKEYWFVTEHKWKDKMIKQKVCSVHSMGNRYIFRTMAITENDNVTINELVLWIKTRMFGK